MQASRPGRDFDDRLAEFPPLEPRSISSQEASCILVKARCSTYPFDHTSVAATLRTLFGLMGDKGPSTELAGWDGDTAKIRTANGGRGIAGRKIGA